MRVKPILFSGPMVRAIMAGAKTQTRRVIKLDIARDNRFPIGKNVVMNIRDPKAVDYAPYQKGDVLWVRETWRPWHDVDAECGCVDYCTCSGIPEHPVCFKAEGFIIEDEDREIHGLKWHPSIFMPKWACRIFLKVTTVRAEWLRDICMKDAYAEGVAHYVRTDEFKGLHINSKPSGAHSAVQAFCALWDSINAKRGYGWDESPWVWVYEFERTAKPEGWPDA